MKQFTCTKGEYNDDEICDTIYIPTGRIHAGRSARRSTQSVPPVKATADVVFYSWWRADPAANLAHLPGFGVEIAEDYRLLAELARLDLAEILLRVRHGHRPYVARISGVPVAYGWSAVSYASIGELGLEFAIPARNRYLWDFATLPAWRGIGIYPRLLQVILSRESHEVERFWIGHVAGNSALVRGIIKAGFGAGGATERRDGRALTFAATGPDARARSCAGLLGRWVAFAQARRAADILPATALLQLSERFEKLMVIPGSQAVLMFGLLAAWLGGHPLLGVLQGARANWLLVSLVLALSMISIIAVLLAPRRKLRRRALEDAVARGALTAELRGALDDRVVLGSRTAEMMITGAILLLMVLKPF